MPHHTPTPPLALAPMVYCAGGKLTTDHDRYLTARSITGKLWSWNWTRHLACPETPTRSIGKENHATTSYIPF